ncbi:reverse transcriptase domain-containing protein [Tanacetum coccineum]
MEDQPLPAEALPTALSPGYIADFDLEEDEEDPEEDPTDHPVDGGDNDDNESSDDDDDDDDVVKDEEDEEDEEEEEHLAPADPFVRVANAIEAIAIYKTKTNMARKSMSQTERQEDKVAENASNKRKWEGNHNGSSSQQNKGHKVPRAHTTRPISKKSYAGSLPLASKPKTMQDAIEFVTKLMDKKISTPAERQAENKRNLDTTSKNNQNQQQPNKRQNTSRAYTTGHGEKKHYGGSKPLGTEASQKATCYECGNQGHYKNDCPKQKNQNHENQTGGTGARGVVHAFEGGETEQDLNNIEDEIDA